MQFKMGGECNNVVHSTECFGINGAMSVGYKNSLF